MTPYTEDYSDLKRQLNAFLRTELGEKISLVGDLSRLRGGFDTDTYAFTVENAAADFPRQMVLRHFQTARESGRVITESTIQNAAYAAGHAVPRVPIDSTGHLINKRYFLLMERLPGKALGTQLEDPSVLQQLPGLMANTQVGLHGIDSTGLYKQLAKSGVDVERMAPGAMLFRISVIADAANEKKLSAVNEWLINNMPDQPEKPVICHGDFHPNNILYVDGKVTGVIDWGNAMFTHAEFDVAITHLTMSIGPPELDAETRKAMQPTIDSLLAGYLASYRKQRPLDNDLLVYYGALRSAHAYAKVIGARAKLDVPYIAGDGYAWGHPLLFNTISRVIETATGVTLGTA
ncbi:MAG: aminoglycoside phosphotransferase family protein [Dehalococcoidia bacterium]